MVQKIAKENGWEFSKNRKHFAEIFTMWNLIGVEYTYFMLVEEGQKNSNRGLMKR